MILDANLESTPTQIDASVIVIGSGAAGLALALSLERAGVDVLVVEAGGDALDKATQDFYRAATIEPESHGPVHLYRRRALGGTTAIWGGRCIPFDPIDFEDRPWIPHARWPVGHADVAPYYAPALEVCRAGPAAFTTREAFERDQGPLVDGVTDPDVILDRVERFSEPTNFAKAYRQVLETSQKLRVLTKASVVEILTNPEGSVTTGVAARTVDGRAFTLRAPRVVVAAGGLEIPRVLLASNSVKPKGLGNDRDLVGRFYQAHIEGEVGEIVFSAPPRDVRLDYQRSPQGVYCRRYAWLAPDAQRREGLAGLILRPHHPKIVHPDHRNPVLSAMYLVKDLILPEYGRKMTSTEQAALASYAGRKGALYAEHIRNIVLGSPKLAGFSVKWTRDRILASRKLPSVVLRDARNRYVLDFNAEQTPNPESRVFLGGEKDALGVPRLSIAWRTVAQDREMIAKGLKVMQKAFASSTTAALHFDDAHFADEVAQSTRIGGHHIGTARMAEGPETGVIDGDGQVFGVEGLYVAGAAAFPTSGFANPTLTIVALALRMADHLKAALRPGVAAAA